MPEFNKKAFAITSLLSLILIIVGFFFVAGLINRGSALAKGPAAEVLCRGSVIARNQFEISYKVGEIHPSPLTCNSQQVSLKKDTETVKKELANLATKCWWQFARGNYRETFSVGFDNQVHCFVCYYIKIEDAKGFNKFTGNELEQWMQENVYSQPVEYVKQEENEGAPASKPTQYYDYVVKDEDGAVVAWLITEPGLVFEAESPDEVTENLYAIAFVEPHSTAGRTSYVQATDMNGIVIAKSSSILATGEKPPYCTVLQSGVGGK